MFANSGANDSLASTPPAKTVAAFCAVEGVSKSHFYYWMSKFAERILAPAPLISIQLTAAPMTAGHLELAFWSELPHDDAPSNASRLSAPWRQSVAAHMQSDQVELSCDRGTSVFPRFNR